MKHWRILSLLLVLLGLIPSLAAQTTDLSTPILPRYYKLNEVRFEAQTWNNCGPATVTNGLSFFGYSSDQKRAANWLKPNYEDKNVNPEQLADFVNTQVPEIPVYATLRYGGNLTLLKTLLWNNFPVIIEKGYDPEPERLGWMGHYLLMIGYSDADNRFITHDSYIGPETYYDYDYIETMWQHFNYTYIVLYREDKRDQLLEILGPDADERQNIVNALEIARQEAIADGTDKFAWFNMGTNFTRLGMYPEAVIAYDEARKIGLPWRMLWYQFGPFEAYYQVGRYDDVLELARANLNDGGGQYVEETYYYGGLAREAKGDTERALGNYQEAIRFNPNFTLAQEAYDRLLATLNSSGG